MVFIRFLTSTIIIINEIKPTRPININIISITLVSPLISSVTPKDRPHVPKADMTSKNTCKMLDLFFSSENNNHTYKC